MSKEKKYLLLQEEIKKINIEKYKIKQEINKNEYIHYFGLGGFMNILFSIGLYFCLLKYVESLNFFMASTLSFGVCLVIFGLSGLLKPKKHWKHYKIQIYWMLKLSTNYRLHRLESKKLKNQNLKKVERLDEKAQKISKEIEYYESLKKDKLDRDLLEKQAIDLLLSGKIDKNKEAVMFFLEKSLTKKNLKKLDRASRKVLAQKNN